MIIHHLHIIYNHNLAIHAELLAFALFFGELLGDRGVASSRVVPLVGVSFERWLRWYG